MIKDNNSQQTNTKNKSVLLKYVNWNMRGIRH